MAKEGYELFESPILAAVADVVVWVAVALSVAGEIVGLRAHTTTRGRLLAVRALWAEIALLMVALAVALGDIAPPMAAPAAIWALALFVRQSLVLLKLLTRTARYKRYAESLRSHPAKVMVLSFLLVICVGSVLLTFPRATTDGDGAAPLDAIFTSASATCVTGLATLNTVADEHEVAARQTFTRFGQFVILILIQLGGLGIMTLSAATLVLAGRRLRLRDQRLMQSLLEENSATALAQTFRAIFVMTFAVELIGATALTARFMALGIPAPEATWIGVFHSVSAFCNAGFSMFGDSLVSLSGDWIINLTHALLIIAGGLGFVVVSVLASRDTWRHGPSASWRRLSVQVKLVLVVSIALIIGGTVLFFFLEYNRSLQGLPIGDKLLASFFQSVSLRTAGFNTVDLSQMSRPMLVISCLWMFIGASPGSTGGGIKTTTVGVLFTTVRAALLGRSRVELWKRTLASEIVARATAIVAIAASVAVIGLSLLVWTQPDIPFEHLLFETVSALGTVGLSMGATSELDEMGKVIVIALMFIGRLGPHTVALAVGQRDHDGQFEYPEARVVVG